MKKLCCKCKKVLTDNCTQIFINGQLVELYICKDCMKEFDENDLFNIFNASLFSDMYEDEYETIKKEVVCKCGATKEYILNTGRFGCSECYKTFSDIVDQYISRLGGKTYAGKTPEHLGKTEGVKELSIEGQIKQLTEKMKECAKNEDYINATKYRNKIIELQKQLNQRG